MKHCFRHTHVSLILRMCCSPNQILKTALVALVHHSKPEPEKLRRVLGEAVPPHLQRKTQSLQLNLCCLKSKLPSWGLKHLHCGSLGSELQYTCFLGALGAFIQPVAQIFWCEQTPWYISVNHIPNPLVSTSEDLEINLCLHPFILTLNLTIVREQTFIRHIICHKLGNFSRITLFFSCHVKGLS